jgi:hypothetical protein
MHVSSSRSVKLAPADAAIAQIPRYARHQVVQARIELMRDEKQVVFVAVHPEPVVVDADWCAAGLAKNELKIGRGLANDGVRSARSYACRGIGRDRRLDACIRVGPPCNREALIDEPKEFVGSAAGPVDDENERLG